ncbi:MAG: hypothetical protein Kow0098_27080 [Ignavibacteriaceae bacterium]
MKKIILLVEDDDINIKTITMFLSGKYIVDNAVDAESALKLADSRQYDLILMDIALKGKINGIELTKALRQKEQYAEVPIIAMTAYAMVGDREVFLNAGCSHYISKPFLRNDLLSLIEDVLK